MGVLYRADSLNTIVVLIVINSHLVRVLLRIKVAFSMEISGFSGIFCYFEGYVDIFDVKMRAKHEFRVFSSVFDDKKSDFMHL